MTRALVAICCVAACATPPPKSVRGYVAPDDRAAIASAVAFGDGLVVRTESGNLVRYDRTLAFAGDSVPPAPVTALVVIDGVLHAGLANGDIGRVDRTLRFERIARVDEAPLWIGTHGGELLVVVRRAVVRVRDGRRVALDYARPGTPHAAALDGDSLWVGIAGGEWGGAIGKIDLVAFTANLDEGSDPVLGFVWHRDRLYRHGGLSHMGSQHGTIAALDRAGIRELWRRSSSPRYRESTPPGRPVHAMIPHGDHWLVVLGNELYETTIDFATWTKRASLPDRARTVAAIELRGTLVLATNQGLFALRGTRFARVTP